MQAILKWLVITAIVLVVFLIVLLGLGYLLKENEQTTSQLKVKLAQETQRQQEKEARRQALFLVQPTSSLTPKLTVFEKSQQKVIADNLSCQTTKECFLMHTNSQALGCIVAVNATGAVILLKTVDEQSSPRSIVNPCQQEYSTATALSLTCQNNTCSFIR